jgi:hypothetical protein
MKSMFVRTAALAVALMALAPVAVLAQSVGAIIQQSTTRLDAAQGVAVSTNFDTVNTQGTATITPPAGQYVYITGLRA